MKRDLDLIRAILLRVEEQPAGQALRNPTIKGYDEATVAEHANLLDQAGYIQAHALVSEVGEVQKLVIYRMTMEGHDFLASIRSPEVYAKTKERLGKVGGTAALEVVKTLAQQVAAQFLGFS